MQGPSPEKVMQLMTGGWAASMLASAAKHGVFDALEEPATVDQVATTTNISKRGAQALLDALAGVGLVTLGGGKYHNTPEASQFLVKTKPSYLGAMSEVFLGDFETWRKAPDAVKTGEPTAANTTDMADNAFWHVLVTAIAPLSFPIAQAAAEKLGLSKAGPISWLDIGGGSGVWSAVWLGANQQATAFQLDWPHVNAIGRGFVSRFGVGDRFQTIDGDFHTVELGEAKYDYAIYSHIAHQESPAENIAMFRKLRRAIKAGGALVINDFVLNDDRTGHPFAMMFGMQMLVATKQGNTYRQSDYRAWLTEAGFASIDIVPTPSPATFIVAR